MNATAARLATPPPPADVLPGPALGQQRLGLELDNVSRRYGTRWALARISFRLERGKALLLTGHNGSGKTTLLRVLSTALRPSRGNLQVLGLDAIADAERIRRRVAFVSHQSFLYDDLTALQNLTLAAELLGLDRPGEQAVRRLAEVGLSTRSHHAVRTFSAGMRKRTAIARLLLKEPELALLDEPFGELDPAGILQMEGIIAGLKARGTTLVLATHLVDQGARLCDERLHLQDGRQVAP